MDDTQEALVRLVQATQLVATRTSLVHAGAPSLLGQLLPTALQLWSQDRLPSSKLRGPQGASRDSPSGSASIRCAARELSETAARLMAADASQQAARSPAKGRFRSEESADSDEGDEEEEEEEEEEEAPIGPCTWEQSQRMGDVWAQNRGQGLGSASRGGQAGFSPHSSAVPSEGHSDASEQAASVCDSLAASRLDSWDSDASMAEVSRGARSAAGRGRAAEHSPPPSMHTSEYLTIEEEHDEEEADAQCSTDRAAAAGSREDLLESQDSQPRAALSPAALQLLLLLRVLRNLCATGSDATRAMAEVGVPAQVAHLVSATIQDATDGAAPALPSTETERAWHYFPDRWNCLVGETDQSCIHQHNTPA
jgi:hypothetical protein